MELPHEFATVDLYLASYLKARGLRMVSIQREGKRSRFIFSDTPARRQMVGDFYNDVPMGIGAFLHALEDLKGAIHNWRDPPPLRSGGPE